MDVERAQEQARALMGAMLYIAETATRSDTRADVSPRDIATIRGAHLHALGGPVPHIDALPRTNPHALAAALDDPHRREYAIRFLVVMAFVDGSVDARRLLLVGDYAAAFGLGDAFLESTYAAARHQFRFMAAYLMGAHITDSHDRAWIEAVLATLFPAYAGRVDPELTARYRQLCLLPADTLGRAVFDHHRVNGLPFPGEATSIGERFGTPHDVIHILGRFALAPGEEVCAAAFSAGMSARRRDDTILCLLFAYRLGILGFERYGRTSFDGRRFWSSFRRGAATNVDFYTDAFHFWDMIEEPVTSLCAKYAIPPAESLSGAAS